MTFVKTRLLIEKMSSGEIAEVRLTGEEPLANVPSSVIELGHKVLCIEEETADTGGEPGVHRIRIQKI